MAKKKNSTKTHRAFSLITYHAKEIVDGILSYRPIRAAAYIFHDKDIKEDGTAKEPHIHILIYTNSHTVAGTHNSFWHSSRFMKGCCCS